MVRTIVAASTPKRSASLREVRKYVSSELTRMSRNRRRRLALSSGDAALILSSSGVAQRCGCAGVLWFPWPLAVNFVLVSFWEIWFGDSGAMLQLILREVNNRHQVLHIFVARPARFMYSLRQFAGFAACAFAA